ncbi:MULTISPECIES: ferredoxin--NADP reductase [unclassified Aureimonas]|uniref:ferredoxin--NADP reductase n=1 Tax=unclassified Aureimonas TaxID=2615206 RepID=UPI0006FD2E80|nr:MULTISPECIES: ferredoxin--NADP reductase [unclassified Aureimonas]KQT70019.1 ferredoxin-NADP reductase [Aureimonas sp. Leaf427]KQT75826.1 ferredoxin-NADP reductase [Aureimonas sp. Leaf460]
MTADALQTTAAPEFPIPAGVYAQTVTSVQHYTDRLFRFRMTRPDGFRFRSGEFVMIGLPNAAKPVFRAYSIASPAWDEELEFFSIKVEDGPLTEHLQKIAVGDTVLMRKKSTGTLVHDALIPGKRLYLFSTGTGIAPFASVIRDPETYEKFETVILTHTTRTIAELQYGKDLVAEIKADELMSEFVGDKLLLHSTATREGDHKGERVTTLVETGKLFTDLGLPPFDPATDRAMICGSMDMLKDTKALCEKLGLVEGSNATPGTFVVERAFVD